MPDGRMAIATAGTITIYDGTRFAAYHLRPEQEYPLSDYHGLRQLTCDSTGLLWLRNDGRLYVVDARRRHVIANVDSLLKKRRLTARQVSAWPDSNNRKKTEYFQTVSRLTSDEISALVRDSYGGLWVGLKESGIMYSNPARKRQFQTLLVQGLSGAIPAKGLVWLVQVLKVAPILRRTPSPGNKKAAGLINTVMQQCQHSIFDFVVLLFSPEQCPPQPGEDGKDQGKELLNPVFQDKVDQWNHLLSHRIRQCVCYLH